MKITANDVLRFVLELFALFSLGFWGYYTWPLPLPGLVLMVATPLFAAVVWGLFRSPKAVFKVDAVGKVLVEVFVMGAAVAVWFIVDQPIIGIVFGIVAAVSGVINGRREFAAQTEDAEAAE